MWQFDFSWCCIEVSNLLVHKGCVSLEEVPVKVLPSSRDPSSFSNYYFWRIDLLVRGMSRQSYAMLASKQFHKHWLLHGCHGFQFWFSVLLTTWHMEEGGITISGRAEQYTQFFSLVYFLWKCTLTETNRAVILLATSNNNHGLKLIKTQNSK